MSSKIMIRSCGSSLRTLIHRHLRPTVAVTYIPTETPPESIYNWHYLLPNSFVPQTVNHGGRFSCDAAGYRMAEEAARGRRKVESVEENNADEDSGSEDDSDDDDPDQWPVTDADDDDDAVYDDDEY